MKSGEKLTLYSANGSEADPRAAPGDSRDGWNDARTVHGKFDTKAGAIDQDSRTVSPLGYNPL